MLTDKWRKCAWWVKNQRIRRRTKRYRRKVDRDHLSNTKYTIASVPEGTCDEDNKQVKTWGETPQFSLSPSLTGILAKL